MKVDDTRQKYQIRSYIVISLISGLALAIEDLLQGFFSKDSPRLKPLEILISIVHALGVYLVWSIIAGALIGLCVTSFFKDES